MTKHYTLKNMDPELWREVKLMAVAKEITIKNLILEMLRKAVRDFKSSELQKFTKELPDLPVKKLPVGGIKI